MKIFRNAIEIYDLVIDTKTVLTKKLMGENIITLNVTVPEILDLLIGDYTTFAGIKYEINRPFNFKKASSVEYEYSIQFESPIYRLLDKIVMLNGKSEFYLAGSCEDFVDLLLLNINSIEPNNSQWTKGTIDPANPDPLFWKNIYLSGKTCKELLDLLATEFLSEYVVVDKNISIHERIEADTDLTFEVGAGKGLYELARDYVDRENTVTRIFVFGSTKNLPSNYRNGESRLIFSSRYLQNTAEYGKIVEKNVFFEGIYPRFTGVIDAVSSDYMSITCTGIDFNVSDQLAPGVKGKVVFLDGDLMGMEFEIKSWDNITKTVELITISQGTNIYPSGSFHAEAGDRFTFTEIDMPTSYIASAEYLLQEMGQKWLDYYSKLRVKYTLTIDARHIKANAITLTIGDIVRVLDSALSIDKQIRITALTISLDGKSITAEISNYKDEIWEKTITASLNDTIQKLTEARNAAISAGSSISALTDALNNQTPNFNQITGAPTDNEYLAKYLNAYPDAKSEIISGAIVWDHDLTYQATEIEYKILGVPYTSKAQEITLATSHPTLSRIDTFYVDMFGNLNVLTGTPAVTPTSAILTAVQLLVMTAYISAGATQPSDLNIALVYDDGAVGEWANSSTHDTYIGVTMYSTDNPRIGTSRIKLDVNVPDTVVESPQHYIGEHYMGGIIIYLFGTDGKSGLIVAEEDVATDVFYSNLSGSSSYGTGATSKAVGSGQANTTLMLANDAAKDDAAKYCDDFITETFTDWYLPSEDELSIIYFHRYKIGGLGSKTYWSSTEDSWNKARCISFGNGVAYTRLKNNQYCVRAMRSFDDNSLTNNKPVASYTPINTKLAFTAAEPLAAENGILSLFIKSTVQWKLNSMLLIESFLGSVKTGTAIISPSTTRFGYKSENNEWQLVAIMMSNFNCNRNTLDCFKISLVGSWTNKLDLGIDVIRYQYSKIDLKKEATLETGVRLVENPDGVRTEFTLPKPYKPGTTKVYAMGVRQYINIDYSETNGKIVFFITPLTGEILTCDYYAL